MAPKSPTRQSAHFASTTPGWPGHGWGFIMRVTAPYHLSQITRSRVPVAVQPPRHVLARRQRRLAHRPVAHPLGVEHDEARPPRGGVEDRSDQPRAIGSQCTLGSEHEVIDEGSASPRRTTAPQVHNALGRVSTLTKHCGGATRGPPPPTAACAACSVALAATTAAAGAGSDISAAAPSRPSLSLPGWLGVAADSETNPLCLLLEDLISSGVYILHHLPESQGRHSYPERC
jgi:hypothetical protein